MRNEVLIEEDLPNVRDVAAPVRPVGVLSAIEVGEDMDVCCAAGVVAGKERFEGSNSVCVGGL